MKRACISIAAVLLVAAPGAQAAVVNAIQAVVEQSVITLQQVRAALLPVHEELARQHRGDAFTYNRRMAEAQNSALRQLVEQRAILHEFQTAGYQLPETVLDDMVEQRIRQRWGDRRTLTKSLQQEGRTLESFRRQLREEIVIEAMIARHTSRDRMISPLKIENFYQANLDQYTLEDRVRLSAIVLNKRGGADDPARALADELLRKIRQGESFGDLAATYSEGSQRAERGDWGWVGRSTLREDLAEVAFSLEPGEVSEVIETEDACYLLRVEAVRRSPRQPLSEVQEEIERILQAEDRTTRYDRWMERLKRKTFIRYF